MSNGTAFARPEPPHAPDPGMRWSAVPADERVWAPAPPGKTCRGQGPDGLAHGAPAALRRMRGIGARVPWHYCVEEHGEGRWVEDVDGEPAVLEWRQVEDEAPA